MLKENKAFGLDAQKGGYYKEQIIIDTLRFASVKDSIFGGSDRYKTMMNIPLEIANGATFELKAGKYEKKRILLFCF